MLSTPTSLADEPPPGQTSIDTSDGGGRGRAVLAMADQGIASLGNFTTSILLARALSRPEFGTFGLILEGVLFFNAIQSALVTYPLSVKGATVDPVRLGRFTTASLALTAVFGLVISSLTLTAGAVSGNLMLAICACSALVMWQAQETLRRAMISHLRYSAVIWGDTVSYLGQGAAIAALTWYGSISIELAFLVIAATSGVAACIQLAQVRPRGIGWAEFIDHARQFLAYGRWQALNNTTVIVSTMGYAWALAWFHGAAAVAELYAMMILLKLTNPLISGMGGLVLATAAKVNGTFGAHRAWHATSRYAWFGAALLVPYFTLLLLFPGWSIRLVHGAETAYADRAGLLRLLVAAAALTYVASTISAFLSGVHCSRFALQAQMMNVLVSLFIGIPLMVVGGITTGIAGTVLAVAAQVTVLIWYLTRVRARPDRAQVLQRLDALIAAKLPHLDRPMPPPTPLPGAHLEQPPQHRVT
jgi:O-antigen/teichoic acid export membrane protein